MDNAIYEGIEKFRATNPPFLMKMGVMLFDGEYRPQEIDFIGINILPLWNLEQEYKLTVGPNNQTSELLIKSTPAIANHRSIG